VIDPGPVLAALAATACTVDTVPYVRDIVRRSTRPHRGSWLIWSVVAVVAAASQGADGARWSLVPLYVQALGTCLVLVLSIRWGTGGMTLVELGLVALAGAGVLGWAVADEPMVATSCVISADVIAASMMLPKAWTDPGSETASLFVLAALSGFLTGAAVGAWSVPLLVYPAYYVLVNSVLAAVIIARRRRARSALDKGERPVPVNRRAAARRRPAGTGRPA
jgi:hypothetical protein